MNMCMTEQVSASARLHIWVWTEWYVLLCKHVHKGLCVWTSTCSCLNYVWFLSGRRPPPCSQAFLQGPKITSLFVLPGLWNNNPPGFPITNAQAKGDRTKNMCEQTRALEREVWQRKQADGKGEVYGGYTWSSDFTLTELFTSWGSSVILAFVRLLTNPQFIGHPKREQIEKKKPSKNSDVYWSICSKNESLKCG